MPRDGKPSYSFRLIFGGRWFLSNFQKERARNASPPPPQKKPRHAYDPIEYLFENLINAMSALLWKIGGVSAAIWYLFQGCEAGKFPSQILTPAPENVGAEIGSDPKNSVPAPAPGYKELS